MKYFSVLILWIGLGSCQNNKPVETSGAESAAQEMTSAEKPDSIAAELTSPSAISVMVIPCSNGYEYNLKMGDLNPSLEKYLSEDKRVQLIPFPLKEMQGSGYFGVYDKKHCTKILERTDVDFLIMTRMKGMDLEPTNADSGNWGYDTRILNTNRMKQFEGISASHLASFGAIDPDIQSKTDQLVKMMMDSGNE